MDKYYYQPECFCFLRRLCVLCCNSIPLIPTSSWTKAHGYGQRWEKLAAGKKYLPALLKNLKSNLCSGRTIVLCCGREMLWLVFHRCWQDFLLPLPVNLDLWMQNFPAISLAPDPLQRKSIYSRKPTGNHRTFKEIQASTLLFPLQLWLTCKSNKSLLIIQVYNVSLRVSFRCPVFPCPDGVLSWKTIQFSKTVSPHWFNQCYFCLILILIVPQQIIE